MSLPNLHFTVTGEAVQKSTEMKNGEWATFRVQKTVGNTNMKTEDSESHIIRTHKTEKTYEGTYTKGADLLTPPPASRGPSVAPSASFTDSSGNDKKQGPTSGKSKHRSRKASRGNQQKQKKRKQRQSAKPSANAAHEVPTHQLLAVPPASRGSSTTPSAACSDSEYSEAPSDLTSMSCDSQPFDNIDREADRNLSGLRYNDDFMYNKMKEALATLADDLEKLRAEGGKQTHSNNRIKEENRKARKQNKDWQVEYGILQKHYSNLNASYNELKAKYKQSKTDLKDQKNVNEEMTRKLDELLMDHDNEIKELTKTIDKRDTEMEVLKSSLTNATKDSEKKDDCIAKKDSEIRDLHTTNGSLKQELQNAKDEMERLKSEATKAQDNLKTELAVQQEAFKTLKDEKDRLLALAETNQNQIERLSKETDERTKQTNAQEDVIANLEKELDTMRNENAERERQTNATQRRVEEDAERKMAEMLTKHAEREQRSGEEKAKLDRELQTHKAELQNSKAELQAHKAELETHKADLQTHKAELDKTKQEVLHANKMFAAKDKEFTKLEDQYAEVKSEKEKAQKEHQEAIKILHTKKESEIKEVRTKLVAKETDFAALLKQLEDLRERNFELSKRNENLHRQHRLDTADLEKRTLEKTELERRLSEEDQENKELMDELKDKDAEIHKLRKRVKEVKKTKDDVITKLQKSQVKREVLTSHLVETADRSYAQRVVDENERHYAFQRHLSTEAMNLEKPGLTVPMGNASPSPMPSHENSSFENTPDQTPDLRDAEERVVSHNFTTTEERIVSHLNAEELASEMQ